MKKLISAISAIIKNYILKADQWTEAVICDIRLKKGCNVKNQLMQSKISVFELFLNEALHSYLKPHLCNTLSIRFFSPFAPEDWFEPHLTEAQRSSFEESLTLIFLRCCWWSFGIAQQTEIAFCLQPKREDKVNSDFHGNKVCQKDAREDAPCHLFLSNRLLLWAHSTQK